MTFHLVDPDRDLPLGADPLVSRRLPESLHHHRAAASRYRPSPALATAVNVALSVGAPLLLTGEPGTGKTQLAWYLAWYFDAGDPQTFQVRSTSTATDLRYHFDTIRYFHAAHDGTQTLTRETYVDKRPLWRAIEAANRGEATVLLIDEVDKAPRDFPNDLLHELDQYAFQVPELDRHRVALEEGRAPPLVVITSNSERRLPPPFLRRCIFHHIVLDEALVRRAVDARRGDYPDMGPDVLEAAPARFPALPDLGDKLRKAPSTGELLVWLQALQAVGAGADELASGVPVRDLPALQALIKDRDDLALFG